jgi:hypothetical protein
MNPQVRSALRFADDKAARRVRLHEAQGRLAAEHCPLELKSSTRI